MSTVFYPAFVYVFAIKSGVFLGVFPAENAVRLLDGVEGVETFRAPGAVTTRNGRVRLTHIVISPAHGKAWRESYPWSVFYAGEAMRQFKTQAEALGYIVAKWPDEAPPALVDEEGRLW